MSKLEDILKLVGITKNDLKNILTIECKFIIKKENATKILDTITVLFDEIIIIEKIDLNLIILFLTISKNKIIYKNDIYYDIYDSLLLIIEDYINDIPKEYLLKMIKLENENYKNIDVDEIGNYILRLDTILTISDCLLNLNEKTIFSYLEKKSPIAVKKCAKGGASITENTRKKCIYEKWLNEIANVKYDNMDRIIKKLLYNYKDINQLTINIAKTYCQYDYIIDCILENSSLDLITKEFAMNPIEIINLVFSITNNDNMEIKNHILDNIHKFIKLVKKYPDILICESLYIFLLKRDTNIWDVQKMFINDVYRICFKRLYYDIIIEFLNNPSFTSDLNINQLLSTFFKKYDDDNYLEIMNVFKNCKSYDVNEILDFINIRMDTLNFKIPELLLRVGNITVDLNLMKKFFRINCYIKNLDIFMKNPYTMELYYLCNNYSVYPDEYMAKFPIDKNVLYMRQYFYNNNKSKITKVFTNFIIKNNLEIDDFTLANYAINLTTNNISAYINDKPYVFSMYVLLRSLLFKAYYITKTDDEIIAFLNSYLKV